MIMNHIIVFVFVFVYLYLHICEFAYLYYYLYCKDDESILILTQATAGPCSASDESRYRHFYVYF